MRRSLKELAEFAKWFLAQPPLQWRPPKAGLRHVQMIGGAATGLVVCRRPPFQVELFCILPSENGSSFPEHRHPNVDSIEVFLSGEIVFTKNGERVASQDMIESTAPDGAASTCGKRLLILSGDMHGGFVGPMGGAFYSIQQWRNGVPPSSVLLDWEGQPHKALAIVQ